MARGKHKKGKLHRDLTDAREAIDAARAQLAIEQQALAAAVAAKEVTDGLKQQLGEAVAARDRACAPECERLASEHGALEQILPQVRRVDRLVGDRWDKLYPPIMAGLGGRVEGLEAFMAIISGSRVTAAGQVVRGKKLDSTQAAAVQRARGERRGAPVSYAGYQIESSMAILNSILPHPAGRVIDQQQIDDTSDDDDDTGRAVHTTIYGVQPHHISSWNPMAWLGEEPAVSTSAAVEALGIVSGGSPVRPVSPIAKVPAQPVATLSAATRRAIAAHPTPEVIVDWREALELSTTSVSGPEVRIPTSITPEPRHPIPADAAALKHWYTNSALGLASRGWQEGPVSELAIATAAAVPYWLPPGHTISYIDSEPLTPADIDDIRMPYPQVFLGLADPLRLDPSSDADPASVAAIEWVEHAVVDMLGRKADYDIFDVVGVGTQGFGGQRASVFDAIAHRGARIEGVVLLSDANGRIDDLFGWCIAIPGAAGGLLGRWTLPALLSETAYRDQVLNLAAVTSWAQWHHAGDEREEPGRAAGGPAPTPQAISADAVRILNVKATGSAATSGSSNQSGQSGHSVTPHIRRGHWRRQHYGPGRAEVKRIRIAPVLVNAALGDIGLRVYRLPPVTAGGRR